MFLVNQAAWDKVLNLGVSGTELGTVVIEETPDKFCPHEADA